VNKVGKCRTKSSQQSRDADGHAQLLRARRDVNGLDPFGDERRVACEGGEVQIFGDGRERAE
jgi:hypothetical protein